MIQVLTPSIAKGKDRKAVGALLCDLNFSITHPDMNCYQFVLFSHSGQNFKQAISESQCNGIYITGNPGLKISALLL